MDFTAQTEDLIEAFTNLNANSVKNTEKKTKNFYI